MAVRPYINRDTTPEEMEHGSWLYAKNIILGKDYKYVANEKGTTLVKGLPYTIIGTCSTGKGAIIFSTDNTTSEIGVLEKGIYTTKLRSVHLNFNTVNPIEAAYKYNYNKELLVAWTDGTQISSSVECNPPRLLNLDNLPFKSGLDGNYELVDSDEIELVKLFPDKNLPEFSYNNNPSSIEDEAGGKLPIGAYYFGIAYYIDEFDTTGVFTISRPFYVMDVISNDKINLFQSAKPGEYISRSIPIRVDGLNPAYKYVEVYCIYKNEGTGQFSSLGKILGRYPVVNTYTTFLLSTLDNKLDIDLSYVLITSSVFTKVKTLTTLENKLYLGNVETKTQLDYQKYANNIKVKWECAQVDDEIEFNYKHSVVASDKKTFEPEEVYALYVGFALKNGTYSQFYHIPGRLPRFWQIPAYYEYTPIANITTPPYNEWVQNEIDINPAVKVFHTKDTSDTHATGAVPSVLGYWENQSEYYENQQDSEVWDSTGYTGQTFYKQRVRHHKMPSLFTIGNSGTLTGKLEAKRIKLVFEDIYVPDEIREVATHVVFAYAKRNFSNSTVVATGTIISQMWWADPTARFEYKDEVGGALTTKKTYEHNPRFYSFNMLLNKPNITPRYMVDSMTFTYEASAGFVRTAVWSPNTDSRQIDIISSLEYHPEDNYSTDPSNEGAEGYIKLTLGSDRYLYFPTTAGIVAGSKVKGVILKNFILNAYSSFHGQSLALMSIRDNSGLRDLSSIPSGTTFTCDAILGDVYYNYYKLGLYKFRNPTHVNVSVDLPMNESSPFNTYTRFWESRKWTTPLTSAKVIENPFNIYEGSLDYISLHDAKVLLPYNPGDKYLDIFPNRLAVSIQQLEEFKGIAWREFITNSYFETTKNKGVVWKLDNDSRSLLIECEFSTFVAEKKDELKISSDVVAALGDAEIFATTPRELIYDNIGYVGCQSQFASYRTRVGNVIVDRNNRKIFIYNGGELDEITRYGLSSWFDENLEYKSISVVDIPWAFSDGDDILFSDDEEILYTDIGLSKSRYLHTDNPATRGISMVWDEEHKRLIFSKCNNIGTDHFVMSYYPEIKKWSSFHIYRPTGMFYNREGVYLIDNTDIYTLNTGKPGVYFGSTVQPTSIDIIFNEPKNVHKLLNSIGWVTEVLSKTTGGSLYDNTLTHAVIYTYNQHSNRLVLTPMSGLNIGNIRKHKRGWKFNEFRDVLNDKAGYKIIDLQVSDPLTYETLPGAKVESIWYNKGYFINSFVGVRLIFDNTSEHRLYLYDIFAKVADKR
jgi:hypothetical protein